MTILTKFIVVLDIHMYSTRTKALLKRYPHNVTKTLRTYTMYMCTIHVQGLIQTWGEGGGLKS